MTATEQPTDACVLALIAQDIGVPVEELSIRSLIAGRPAVFYRRNGVDLCACAVDSEYWRQAAATVIAAAAIARASRSS